MANSRASETDWQAASRSFDAVASLYDAHRPGYPEALVETVIATARLQGDARILEVGCGTGKATILFARRGYSIVCVEPGANLAAVAARSLSAYPRVEFEIARFEEWPERAGEFDLVMSAQAFHWVPREAGYARAARALKEGGHLALFWNMYPDPQGKIHRELDRAYQACAPELAGRRERCEVLIAEREAAIAESGCFTDVEVRRFPWCARYDTRQYLGLLNTYSDHLTLPAETRDRLFEGITRVIDRHGGYIDKPYLAVVYTACKAQASCGDSARV